MSINDPSSANDSTPADCLNEFWSLRVAFSVTNIVLLLPLSVSVLCLGLQRSKRRRSSPSAAAMTLSDFVTYNMAVMELIGVLGSVLSIVGGYANLRAMELTGVFVVSFPWYGQMFFPILTSVECYLAVVHPITYVRLRQTKGVRIRNISTACIWFLNFAGMGLLVLFLEHRQWAFITGAGQMAFLLVAVTFCSLSVLCVLIRPRPGRASGAPLDPSKKRAFHTILVMMGVLQLRFGGSLVSSVVGLSPSVGHMVVCGFTMSTGWWNLPSSLLLPLLFLHRAGRLPGSSHKTESGRGPDHIK